MIYEFIQYILLAAAFSMAAISLFLWVLLIPVWRLPRIIRMYLFFRRFGESRVESIKQAWKWVN